MKLSHWSFHCADGRFLLHVWESHMTATPQMKVNSRDKCLVEALLEIFCCVVTSSSQIDHNAFSVFSRLPSQSTRLMFKHFAHVCSDRCSPLASHIYWTTFLQVTSSVLSYRHLSSWHWPFQLFKLLASSIYNKTGCSKCCITLGTHFKLHASDKLFLSFLSDYNLIINHYCFLLLHRIKNILHVIFCKTTLV